MVIRNNRYNICFYLHDRFCIQKLLLVRHDTLRRSAREIATCKQNVDQKEDLMHSNFQMDISLPWIDAAFT
jgi:hypothetical protein